MSEKPEQDPRGASPGPQPIDDPEKDPRQSGSETSRHESSVESDLARRESDIESDLSQASTATAHVEGRGEDGVEGADVTETTPQSRRIRASLRRAWRWKPKPARYDVDNPPEFTIWLNILFAFAAGVTVANLYYGQAILDRMADTFNVSFERVSLVATLMQAGYAGGLFFICPLGDVFPERTVVLVLITFTASIWTALCVTTSFVIFSTVSFFVGLTTVAPQLFLPLVGELAPANRRASCLSVVVSGLAVGTLVARILSGALASLADSPDSDDLWGLGSWRAVYWFSLAAQWLFVVLLYVWMPDYPRKRSSIRGDDTTNLPDSHPPPNGVQQQTRLPPCLILTLSALTFYLRMLLHILHLLTTTPLLAQSAAIAFLLSAHVIGLFGLIGFAVALLGPLYARFVIDKAVPLVSALAGLLVELVGVSVGTFWGATHVAGPAVEAVAVDLGGQMAQIANRAAIYEVRPGEPNGVNTAYMVVSYAGQMCGTAVGNRFRLYWLGFGDMSGERTEGDGVDWMVRGLGDTKGEEAKVG
ncbi:hypothetical protein VTJ49DRAFT_1007 [Mycothermus thermophilus]|uniref:Major facilitator superfamily (MFS) profile domain-containing protein n=1 Tax=Humicola insolens TaxID=85995 RepID=A0ABR3VDG7_HUMIN